VIFSFALEFEDEKTMRAAVKKLWDGLKITGEIEVNRLSDGRWRIDVHAESTVRESTIEALGGTRVKARSAVARI
jgi:hypothetical protein